MYNFVLIQPNPPSPGVNERQHCRKWRVRWEAHLKIACTIMAHAFRSQTIHPEAQKKVLLTERLAHLIIYRGWDGTLVYNVLQQDSTRTSVAPEFHQRFNLGGTGGGCDGWFPHRHAHVPAAVLSIELFERMRSLNVSLARVPRPRDHVIFGHVAVGVEHCDFLPTRRTPSRRQDV